MDNSLLQSDIAIALGINELTPEAQAAFLAEVGDVILETSLVRFSAILSEPQHIALQEYLETEPEPDVLLRHLLEHYEEFADILAAVSEEFKTDALETFKKEGE